MFVFLSYWKNFVGTEKRVRIIQGKRAIRVRAIEVILYNAVAWRVSMKPRLRFYVFFVLKSILHRFYIDIIGRFSTSYITRETTSVIPCLFPCTLSPFWKGSPLKGINLLPVKKGVYYKRNEFSFLLEFTTPPPPPPPRRGGGGVEKSLF